MRNGNLRLEENRWCWAAQVRYAGAQFFVVFAVIIHLRKINVSSFLGVVLITSNGSTHLLKMVDRLISGFKSKGRPGDARLPSQVRKVTLWPFRPLNGVGNTVNNGYRLVIPWRADNEYRMA